MQEKIKILMVEDQSLFRVGLRSLFEDYPEFDVIAEAEDGDEAVEMLEHIQPDLILMDIGLPRMNGIDATRIIKEKYPKIKVVILTSHTDEKEVTQCLEAGADAYAIKDIKTDYLKMVIQSVKDGAFWLDPQIVHVIKNRKPGAPPKPQSRASFKAEHANLTEREYEVLKLVVEGKSNNEIADELKISEHTAKAHVCNIIQKLVVDDRTQAAVKAIKDGLVTP